MDTETSSKPAPPRPKKSKTGLVFGVVVAVVIVAIVAGMAWSIIDPAPRPITDPTASLFKTTVLATTRQGGQGFVRFTVTNVSNRQLAADCTVLVSDPNGTPETGSPAYFPLIHKGETVHGGTRVQLLYFKGALAPSNVDVECDEG